MSQDTCLTPSVPARAPHWPSLAPIAVILLAALVVAALFPAPPSPNANAQPTTIEDWHGNVMRSHWTDAAHPR